jgi:hypothetical protein
VPHGTRGALLREAGLDAEGITDTVLTHLSALGELPAVRRRAA